MNKILISVVDSERAAFEGLSALKDLHRAGDITLYASSVIAKDASGVLSVRQSADPGPVGTLVGVVTGGLVGLLGGPVGVAVGAYVGGIGGLMFDLFNAGVGIDLVDEVSASLTPGKAAIVADIDETWVTPVETRLHPIGATTFRRLPGDVVDEALTRETADATARLEQLRAELQNTTGEARARVEATIETQRQQLEALMTRIGTALAQRKAAFEAKLATLKAQRAHAREGEREQIDARTAELKAAHEARQNRLEQSHELARESIELTREAMAFRL